MWSWSDVQCRVLGGGAVRHALLSFCACAVVPCIGCKQGDPRWNWFAKKPAATQPNPPEQANNPDSAAPVGENAPTRQISLQFEVVRIDLPAGTASADDRLWRLLDELITTPNKASLLRENGFRFGVGRADVRGAFRQAVESIAGMKAAADGCVPRGDKPVEIMVSQATRDEAVFFFEAGGAMRGLTFSQAQPWLRVTVLADSTAPAAPLRLRAVPELREPPGPPKYKRTDEGFVAEGEYRGEVFEACAIDAVIPGDGFLVLGPTPEASQKPLLARPFLSPTADADMAPRENLIVFIPRFGQTTSWWSAAPGGGQ